MTTINLPNLLDIDFDILQIENEYKTFQVKLACVLHHHTSHKKMVFDSLWFENAKWDDFITYLDKGLNDRPAVLADISKKNFIKVMFDLRFIKLKIESKERFADGYLNFDSLLKMNSDQFSVFRSGFKSLDKWW
jgi:hypothetical protein